MAWPAAENAGFLVVVAESENEIARLKLRPLWILTEFESEDVEKIAKRMYDLQNRYMIQSWYGDTDNLMMLHFIDRFNQKLSPKKTGLYIAEAAFVGETHSLRIYAHQIKNKTAPEKKILTFGGNSVIPLRLNALSPDNEQKKKAEGYPAIAALGDVLSGLDEPYCDVSKDREIHEQFVQQKTLAGL